MNSDELSWTSNATNSGENNGNWSGSEKSMVGGVVSGATITNGERLCVRPQMIAALVSTDVVTSAHAPLSKCMKLRLDCALAGTAAASYETQISSGGT